MTVVKIIAGNLVTHVSLEQVRNPLDLRVQQTQRQVSDRIYTPICQWSHRRSILSFFHRTGWREWAPNSQLYDLRSHKLQNR